LCTGSCTDASAAPTSRIPQSSRMRGACGGRASTSSGNQGSAARAAARTSARSVNGRGSGAAAPTRATATSLVGPSGYDRSSGTVRHHSRTPVPARVRGRRARWASGRAPSGSAGCDHSAPARPPTPRPVSTRGGPASRRGSVMTIPGSDPPGAEAATTLLARTPTPCRQEDLGGRRRLATPARWPRRAFRVHRYHARPVSAGLLPRWW
jgi:hypothetical protein